MLKLENQQIKSYLKQLGVTEIDTPSKEFLFVLHQAHVKKFPWQTVDIFAGFPHPIETEHSIELILSGKSGYCFHLNGAFALLLQSLGFQVSMHRSGVQSRGSEPCIDSNHLGLVVCLEGTRWIVDVGLGDMIYEPVPLIYGEYTQGDFTYHVEDSIVVEKGWRLVHDPKGTFAGIDVDPKGVKDISIFRSNHQHLSTSPNSPWVNLLVAKNRHAAGSNALTGCVFRFYDTEGFHTYEVMQKAEWLDILSDVFGIHLTDYTGKQKDDLWQKVLEKHLAWKNSIN